MGSRISFLTWSFLSVSSLNMFLPLSARRKFSSLTTHIKHKFCEILPNTSSLTLYLASYNISVFAIVFTYLSPSLDCELAEDKNWFGFYLWISNCCNSIWHTVSIIHHTYWMTEWPPWLRIYGWSDPTNTTVASLGNRVLYQFSGSWEESGSYNVNTS